MYRLVITTKKNGKGLNKKEYLLDKELFNELWERAIVAPQERKFIATQVHQGLIFIHKDKFNGIQFLDDVNDKELESPPDFEGLILYTTHPINEIEEDTDDGLYVSISDAGHLSDIANHFIDCVVNNINFDFLDDDSEDVIVNMDHIVAAEFWHRNIDKILP
jgi:hypothetical protein